MSATLFKRSLRSAAAVMAAIVVVLATMATAATSTATKVSARDSRERGAASSHARREHPAHAGGHARALRGLRHGEPLRDAARLPAELPVRLLVHRHQRAATNRPRATSPALARARAAPSNSPGNSASQAITSAPHDRPTSPRCGRRGPVRPRRRPLLPPRFQPIGSCSRTRRGDLRIRRGDLLVALVPEARPAGIFAKRWRSG